MRLCVSQRELRNFRRRAMRRYPNEYLEALWGIKNGSGWSVVEFRPIEHDAGTETIDYDGAEGAFGERDGSLVRLGLIHTHPDTPECAPSEHDWKDSSEVKELITGIFTIEKIGPRLRSRIRFFQARALCDMVIR